MNCPFCTHYDTKVIDSRPTDEGSSIRRRRECISCKSRFTTYEKIDQFPLLVIKRDGSRQPFNRSKIIGGLIKACEKRSVSLSEMERIADYVEKSIQNNMIQEITSLEIGELVAKELKTLDEISYVRFASVYKQFKDVDSLKEEVDRVIRERKKE